MNLFTLLLHSFLDRQAREQTERLREAGLRAAEKGRKLAIAGAFFSLTAAFSFAAIVTFAIEAGLQYDRGAGLTYSGLMISATILIVIALLGGLIGLLIASSSSENKVNAQPPPPRSTQSELKDVLEDIALQLLKQFAQSQRAGDQTPSSANESETRP